jgi:hypothetical protein
MEILLERRTVTHSQYALIWRLFDLMTQKPFTQA